MFIIEWLVEVIFQIMLNSIGSAIRWLFFFGKYSYSRLFEQETKNIAVAVLFFVAIIGGGIYLNENSKKEPQEQESSLIIKTKLSSL